MQTATELDLSDQVAALTFLHQIRVDLGMSLGDMEDKSGISITSFYVWKSGARSPQLANLVALSQTLGFDVMASGRSGGAPFLCTADSPDLWPHIESLISDAGLPTSRFNTEAGVSTSSFYSWTRGERSPTLKSLSSMASHLGFRVFLRKRHVSKRRPSKSGEIFDGWHARADRQAVSEVQFQ